MFELHIHWYTGEKEIYYYDSLEIAREREHGFYTVFGDQVRYSYIRQVTYGIR